MMAGFSESPDCTTDDTTNDFLIGLLVDVSPSMKKAFSLTLNRSICGNLNRTHAITVALIRIVQQEIAAHKRSDQVFVGAFGLRDVHTCDLISLLKYVLNLSPAEEVSDEILESARKDREEGSNGYINLIGLAMRHGAPHAEIWIKNCLTEPQAGVLYTILTRDENLRKSFISELSGRFTSGFLGVNSAVLSNQLGDVLQNTAQDSNAYKIAVEAINRFTEVITYLQKSIPKPLPIPVQEVSFLIDKLLQNTHMLSSPQAFEANVKDLFGLIEPFIYGGTPMCECLKYTTEVFDLWNVPNKVLFILSDGDSTDGDPVPIGKHLLDSNVTIAPCFITAKEIANPRRLIDKIEGDAEIGAVQLFEMSSTVPNNEPPVTYFIDAGWELPNSGESRLFLQANSIDVVDEFHEIISNHVKNRTCVDALINVLATIDLANYINAGVKPDKQEGNTCYAYAIAAVYHLAMHRNVGGILTIPSFKEMCQELCKLPPNIKYVLEHTSGKYHLKSAKIDKENPENEARRVLNKRRPLVAKFELSKMQWVKFRSFFRKSPKRMLQVNDIPEDTDTKTFGHAVVLIRCSPTHLTFMNSWGHKWGDGGFFHMKNASVLPGIQFYDILTIDEAGLTSQPARKNMDFKRRGVNVAKKISTTLDSINELPYKCPICKATSKVREYTGYFLEAQCPRCHSFFKPDDEGIMQSLYMSSRDVSL